MAVPKDLTSMPMTLTKPRVGSFLLSKEAAGQTHFAEASVALIHRDEPEQPRLLFNPAIIGRLHEPWLLAACNGAGAVLEFLGESAPYYFGELLSFNGSNRHTHVATARIVGALAALDALGRLDQIENLDYLSAADSWSIQFGERDFLLI